MPSVQFDASTTSTPVGSRKRRTRSRKLSSSSTTRMASSLMASSRRKIEDQQTLHVRRIHRPQASAMDAGDLAAQKQSDSAADAAASFVLNRCEGRKRTFHLFGAHRWCIEFHFYAKTLTRRL